MTKQSAGQLKVRLSAPLKTWLRRQAEANCRSLNGEIVFRLEVARLAEQNGRPEGGAPAAGATCRG
jgi:hypothetical protein